MLSGRAAAPDRRKEARGVSGVRGLCGVLGEKSECSTEVIEQRDMVVVVVDERDEEREETSRWLACRLREERGESWPTDKDVRAEGRAGSVRLIDDDSRAGGGLASGIEARAGCRAVGIADKLLATESAVPPGLYWLAHDKRASRIPCCGTRMPRLPQRRGLMWLGGMQVAGTLAQTCRHLTTCFAICGLELRGRRWPHGQSQRCVWRMPTMVGSTPFALMIHCLRAICLPACS